VNRHDDDDDDRKGMKGEQMIMRKRKI